MDMLPFRFDICDNFTAVSGAAVDTEEGIFHKDANVEEDVFRCAYFCPLIHLQVQKFSKVIV